MSLMSSYHFKNKNLLRSLVTPDIVADAKPHNDWVLLSAVGDDPIHALRDEQHRIMKSRGIKPPVTQISDSISIKHSSPIVFEVLSIGPKVTTVQPGDLVSITFIAGDKFAASSVVACQEPDIVFTFGKGIEMSQEEAIKKAAEIAELHKFFAEEKALQEEEAKALEARRVAKVVPAKDLDTFNFKGKKS